MTNLDFLDERIPDGGDAAFAHIKQRKDALLGAYDTHVLRGYDAGEELRMLMDTGMLDRFKIDLFDCMMDAEGEYLGIAHSLLSQDMVLGVPQRTGLYFARRAFVDIHQKDGLFSPLGPPDALIRAANPDVFAGSNQYLGVCMYVLLGTVVKSAAAKK